MTEVAALGLRVDGVADIDRASSSLDRFTKSSKSADQASGGLATESRNTSKSLAEVAREGGRSSASISKLAGAAKLAAGAFAGIKLTGLIKDVTMANSRFEQLGLVMGVVGRNAGLSQGQVNAYAKEVEAMGISMTESRQTVIKMTQAQMDLSKASELARLAQDAAVIANTNSSEALNRLIYGLQSGQVEILRNMGLNVNFAGSYSKLAAEMGVTVEQLSEVDKVQARTNAVMEAGSQIAGAYEASMENAGKQLGSTTRYLQDLGVMWGEVFSEAGREAIFGYSDALKGVHATTKQMREDGTLESISKAIGTLARGLVTAAKVTGAFAVAMYAIPALQGAWTLALAAKATALKLFTAQVVTATGALGLLQRSLMVVAAAFAGLQIGTYLRNEFEIVEKAGIALMGGMHRIAIHIGGFFERLGESISFALTNPLDAFRNKLADLLQSLTGLGQGALRTLGLDGFADAIGNGIEKIRSKTGEEHRAMLEQMKKDTRREADAVSDIYADMFANVGKSAGTTAGKVGELNAELGDIGSSGNVSGIKKVDTAFQSLMDTLFPAEAAQRKYNEQVALLKKHLQGDALAKAIDRLNDSLADGDHTGPADAIAAYVEELQNLEDKINPAGRAMREFQEEQAKLRAEIERSGDPTGKWTRLLEENERQMRENTRVTNQWTEWTESALERVDSAFAGAWRNIGDGFSSFRDSLTNAFKQMLAELAHLAITRPIVMQIGAAMGIGGAAAQLSSMGGGGFDLIGMLGRGVSLSQSGFGQAVISGWKSGEGVLGGLQGAFGSGSSYVSGLFGGGGAAGAGTGSTIAGYTGPEFANWVAQQNMAAQTWGGAATSLGAILGGLGGAYMGWQQNGLKGAVGTGLASWGGGTLGGMGGAALGQAIGGTIGSVLPGIGTAIGVALGGLLGGSLFGGSGEQYKRTVGSATGSYIDGQYTSGGQSQTWFAGYHRTFGDEFNQSLDDLNRQFSSVLGGLFDAFDIDSTIDTETRARQRRTSGRLATDFLVAIDGEMSAHLRQYGGKGDVGKAMEEFADDIMGEYLAKTIVNSALPEYLRDQFRGLTEADQVAETLAGVIARFDGVNSALDLVGITLLETTDAGLRAADAIAAMGGGIEAFNASVGVYYDQFYSAAEKQAHVIDAVTAAFEAADIPLADSREAYRAMVESIDVTTEAGQEMFAAMMSLAGQAAQYYSIVEQEAAQAAAMAEQEAAQRLANAANYYDLFATDAEKAQDQLSGIFNAFRDSGLYLARTREGFRDVIGALDTSTEAGRQAYDSYMAMAGLANTYYDIMETRQAKALAAEQELAAAELRRYDEIKRAADSVSSSLGGFRETLILDQLGDPDAQYAYFKAQADGMARLASTLTDPQAIAEAARDASSYAARAYGLLDDEQKNQMGGEMLDFVNRLEAMSHQRIEQSEQRSAEVTAEATAAAVGKEVGRIADAIISHLNRSGEGTRELVSAIRAVASHTGSQYAPQYEEVNA